jgi:hypothetical protein
MRKNEKESAGCPSQACWNQPTFLLRRLRTSGRCGSFDILLQKGGSTLAAIEAVICDLPVHRQSVQQDLARHFTKLFTYSTGTLYFHVTYVFAEDL